MQAANVKLFRVARQFAVTIYSSWCDSEVEHSSVRLKIPDQRAAERLTVVRKLEALGHAIDADTGLEFIECIGQSIEVFSVSSGTHVDVLRDVGSAV